MTSSDAADADFVDPNVPLSPGLRRHLLLLEVNARGFLTVEELSHLFKVSKMTVHRDLEHLHAYGQLKKVHGGASRATSQKDWSSLEGRVARGSVGKQRIARQALSLLSHGDSLFLDDSTTSLALATQLSKMSPPPRALRVLTNFVPIAEVLANDTDISLIFLGGTYCSERKGCYGPLAEEGVNQLRADSAFISAAGFVDSVVFTNHEGAASSKRKLLSAASRRVLLMDGGKVGTPATYKVVSAHELTDAIISGPVEPQQVADLSDSGVRVQVL